MVADRHRHSPGTEVECWPCDAHGQPLARPAEPTRAEAPQAADAPIPQSLTALWRSRGWRVSTEENSNREHAERWTCEVMDGSEEKALPRGLGYVCGYGATLEAAVGDAEFKLLTEVAENAPGSPPPQAGTPLVEAVEKLPNPFARHDGSYAIERQGVEDFRASVLALVRQHAGPREGAGLSELEKAIREVAAAPHNPPDAIAKASPRDAFELGYSAAIFGTMAASRRLAAAAPGAGEQATKGSGGGK